MPAELKINISADVQNVLTGFDKVLAKTNQLAKLGALEIPISLDTDNFKQPKLKPITVQTEVDLSGVQKGLKTIEVDPSLLTLTPRIDESSFHKSIQTITDRLNLLEDPTIDIHANAARVQNVINEIRSELQKVKTSGIELSADGSRVLAVIDTLEKELVGLEGSVTLDTSTFQSQVRSLQKQTEGLLLTPSVDILLNEGEINKSILRISQKLESLQAPNLSVDITANAAKIENVIKEILSELNKIKSSDINLKADGSKVLQVIDNLEAELKTLQGNVTIDTSLFQQQVQKLKQQTEGILITPHVEVILNEVDVERSLIRISEKLDSLKDPQLNVLVNPAQAEATIKDIIAEVNNITASEITLNADNSKVLAQIRGIQERLSSLRANISIDVRDQLERIKNQIGSLTVRVGGDVTAFNETVKIIQSKLASIPEIDIKVDSKLAESEIKEVISLIAKLKDSEFVVNADNSPALAVIKNIETELQTLTSKITLDSAGFIGQVESLKAKLSGVDFKVNTNQVEEQINSLQQKILSLPELALRLNDEEIRAEIGAIIGQLNALEASELFLQVNDQQARATIENLRHFLTDIKAKIEVDDSDIQKSVKNIQSLLAPIQNDIDIKVGSVQAEATIKEITGRLNQLRGSEIELNLDGKQVITTVELIQKELTQLQQKLRQATDPKEVLGLNKALLQIRDSVKGIQGVQLQNQLRGISSASGQGTFALTNFGRVLQDLPFGVLGVANNITPLVESMRALSIQAKQTGSSLGRELLNSLKGGGGLILGFSAVTAAIQFATLGLSFFTRNLGTTKNTADKAEDSLDNLKKTVEDLVRPISRVRFEGIGAAQGDVTRVQTLATIVDDLTLSYQQRNNALKELQSINKNYFGDLTLEASNIAKLKDRVTEYTQALIAQSVVKAFLDDIGKVTKEFTIQADTLNILRKSYDNLYGSKTFRARDADVQLTIEESKHKKDLKNRINEQETAVSELGSQYERLRIQLLDAQKVALAFKPFNVDAGASMDNIIDDIIAKAKLAAEAFGEAFIVPDLEITFFKDKQTVFKEAQKFLGDVKSFLLGNIRALTAKIPVNPEFELLLNDLDPIC